jgi:nucleoside-diphosphate-sugar epimerase
VEKARRLLGWESRIDLRDGLAGTVAWLRETSAPAATP